MKLVELQPTLSQRQGFPYPEMCEPTVDGDDFCATVSLFVRAFKFNKRVPRVAYQNRIMAIFAYRNRILAVFACRWRLSITETLSTAYIFIGIGYRLECKEPVCWNQLSIRILIWRKQLSNTRPESAKVMDMDGYSEYNVSILSFLVHWMSVNS